MLKFAFKDVSTKNSEPTYWTNRGRFAPITCSLRVVSPRKVNRFAPLNRYYIIIDEVFFDNFFGNYLFISCMAKKIYMCVYGHPTHPIFQPPTLSIFTQNLDNHFCCLINSNVLFIQPLAFCRNWEQRR
jgi:hypothetical protein